MSKRPKRVQISIPDPFETLSSLRSVSLATKEAIETLMGQRGSPVDVAVTWGDLINLGLVKKEQVPPDVGSHRLE